MSRFARAGFGFGTSYLADPSLKPRPDPPPPPPPPGSGVGPFAGSEPTQPTPAGTGEPAVLTRPAFSVGAYSAILESDVHTNGSNSLVWFEYGTDPTLATFTKTPNQNWPVTEYPSNFFHRAWQRIPMAGELQTNVTYYFRAAASNASGTTKGTIRSFQTTPLIAVHRYPNRSHARFSYHDFRLVVGRFGLTALSILDEFAFVAQHYDLVSNGKRDSINAWNNFCRTGPYITGFWFQATQNQASWEASVANAGFDPELTYLHYPAGANVGGYTHNEDGYVVAPHVSDGSKIRDNRVWDVQFQKAGYHYMNIQDPGYQQVWRARTQANVNVGASGFQSDFIWYDTHGRFVVESFIPAVTVEYANRAAYWADHEAFLAEIRDMTPEQLIIINNAQRFNNSEEQALIDVAGGCFSEFVNGAYRNCQWNAVRNIVARGKIVQFNCAQDHAADQIHKVKNGNMVPGNYPTITDRCLMFEYVSYLSCVDPNNMDLLLFDPNINAWDIPFHVVWRRAWEVDIGLATSDRTVAATGTDPAGQSYTLYTREFERARIYIRGVLTSGQTNFGNTTAISHNLPAGNWKMLNQNGTLGPAVTSFQIRHGEGLIFWKA